MRMHVGHEHAIAHKFAVRKQVQKLVGVLQFVDFAFKAVAFFAEVRHALNTKTYIKFKRTNSSKDR